MRATRRRLARRAAISATIVAGIALVGAVIANVTWTNTSARTIRRLDDRPPGGVATIGAALSSDAFAKLPRIVRRYFIFALPARPRIVERARFAQSGTMRTSPQSSWKGFAALEEFSTHPVGFVWDASMTLLPLAPVRIRDQYVSGRGSSEASIAGLVSLARQAGTPEIDAASLIRYLAETPWFPTALLPGRSVAWSPLKGDRARASLTDGATTVSVDFDFATDGRIVRASTKRFRDVDGKQVLTQWHGRYFDYQRSAGMMIPSRADVSWKPPEGEFTVWRGRILSARFYFAGVR